MKWKRQMSIVYSYAVTKNEIFRGELVEEHKYCTVPCKHCKNATRILTLVYFSSSLCYRWRLTVGQEAGQDCWALSLSRKLAHSWSRKPKPSVDRDWWTCCVTERQIHRVLLRNICPESTVEKKNTHIVTKLQRTVTQVNILDVCDRMTFNCIHI